MLDDLINNRILLAGLTSWWLAQLLKPLTNYIGSHQWDWGMWFSSGGMPSSHSSLMTAVTLSIGLYLGFGSPLFALAVAISMIVIYDAAGVRRQAGLQAQKINELIKELFSGQPISDQTLKEVLGHTPGQVTAGVLLGLIVAVLFKSLWP
jgi:uncharacterized protein